MNRPWMIDWAPLCAANSFASDYSYPTRMETSLPLSPFVESSQLPEEFFRRIARHDHWRTSLAWLFFSSSAKKRALKKNESPEFNAPSRMPPKLGAFLQSSLNTTSIVSKTSL